MHNYVTNISVYISLLISDYQYFNLMRSDSSYFTPTAESGEGKLLHQTEPNCTVDVKSLLKSKKKKKIVLKDISKIKLQ